MRAQRMFYGYAKFLAVLCLTQGFLVYFGTFKHHIGIEITIRDHDNNVTTLDILNQPTTRLDQDQQLVDNTDHKVRNSKNATKQYHQQKRNTTKAQMHNKSNNESNRSGVPSNATTKHSVTTKKSTTFTHGAPSTTLLRNAQQCNRNYGAALNFSAHYPTKKECPKLPHFGLAYGSRPQQQPESNDNADNNSIPPPFVPKDCQFKWFHPEEACDLIGSLGVLYFDGDSLIRQLMVGLGAVLDGNFRTGGLGRTASQKQLEACQCETSWQCWADTTHRFTPSEPQFALCPKWTRNHILTGTIDDYLQRHQNTSSSSQDPLITIANGNGLHEHLDFRKVYQKMDTLREASKASGGTLIPMTVHWPGPNKPPQYRIAQGEGPVQRYNNEMRKWSMYHKLWPLETYDYTGGLWSRDGTHYDDDNIVMVQLLLNHLWYMQLHEKLPVVQEENRNDPSTFSVGKPQDLDIETNHGPVPRPY